MFNASSLVFTGLFCSQFKKLVLGSLATLIRAQLELSSTFVYEYEMRRAALSVKNLYLSSQSACLLVKPDFSVNGISKILPCLCFPSPFSLVVNYFSTGEISRQSAVSDIPLQIKFELNKLHQ